ncbi:MAG TPA: carboxylating nicotinate-nucleotide diphosphorylase [Bacteroidales bacterium]
MTLEEIVKQALAEDIGEGDHTSLATIPEKAVGKVQLIAKEDGILAGIEVFALVFKTVDPSIKMEILAADGKFIRKGQQLMVLEGKARALLTAERTALNFIQRMSGIATFTNKLVRQMDGYRTKLLDTRKTTPGNRLVEKMAVKMGGGHNHRFGLYDMILIKDNHVDFAGGIVNAINSTKEYFKKNKKDLKIEIEVRNFLELHEVLDTGGVDRILFDNFSTDDLLTAVQITGRKIEKEASGNITLNNIREYAETGVDFISVGALTHQIKSLDMSLKTIK